MLTIATATGLFALVMVPDRTARSRAFSGRGARHRTPGLPAMRRRRTLGRHVAPCVLPARGRHIIGPALAPVLRSPATAPIPVGMWTR